MDEFEPQDLLGFSFLLKRNISYSAHEFAEIIAKAYSLENDKTWFVYNWLIRSKLRFRRTY